mmetsp:Transcript_8935/g.11169  ORF Transcript_8935/g.11169 Transcript_8935/m.11169 type:complete len:520 (-) Transcript_8935:6-1565(-)
MVFNVNRKRKFIQNYEDGANSPEDLTHFELDPMLTRINTEAFRDCCNITSVIIPDLVTVIELCGFLGCESIVELQFSSSLQKIEKVAFGECSSIPDLYFPPLLHTIGESSFSGCTSVKNISSQQKDIPLSIKTIETLAFEGCFSLSNLPYLSSLQRIGKLAFLNCNSLTEVTLAPSVTVAARNSFDGCTSLKILRCTYREGSVVPWAVTDIILDCNTKNISNSAFAGCESLCRIILTLFIRRIGKSSFWGCESLPQDFIVPDSVIEVGIGAFARSSNFKSRSMLPRHATQEVYTFMGGEGESAPKNVTKVVIDESVKEIVTDAFYECNNLDEVVIHRNVIKIKEEAFNFCPSLRTVRFHKDAVMTIEPLAFSYCKHLHNVTMPRMVQNVLEGKIGSIISKENQQILPTIYQDSFHGCPSEIVQHFKRCSILLNLWHWISKKKLICFRSITSITTAQSMAQNSFRYDALNSSDIDLLRQVFTIFPPPKDLIDEILELLHSYDVALRRLPRDLILKVLQFL